MSEFPKSIVSDTYAPHGTIVLPPDKPGPTPEDFERERRADPATKEEIKKDFGWNDEQFAAASSVGFPPTSGMRLRRPRWFGDSEVVPYWSRKAIAQWRERILALKVK